MKNKRFSAAILLGSDSSCIVILILAPPQRFR